MTPKKPSVFAYVMQPLWKPYSSVLSMSEFYGSALIAHERIEVLKNISTSSTQCIKNAMRKGFSAGGKTQ